MKIIAAKNLVPFCIYSLYVVDQKQTFVRKGIYQFEGMDGDDYVFKRTDDYTLGKKYNMYLIPKEVIDRFEFHFHTHLNNGLCEMPPIEGED
jgi:hypothetical protein